MKREIFFGARRGYDAALSRLHTAWGDHDTLAYQAHLYFLLH